MTDRVYRHRPPDWRERAVLDRLITPGSRVLDIGCAATGRSAAVLDDLGADVFALDIDPLAVRELSEDGISDTWHLAVADMCRLPFRPGVFAGAVIAFHGFDYLLTRPERRRAIAEIARVVGPGGTLVLDAYNRWSAWLDLPARPGRRLLTHRAKYLAAGGPLKATFEDFDGRELRHDRTSTLRRDIEVSSDFRLTGIFDRKANERSWRSAQFLVPEPILTFRRPPNS